MKDELEGSQSDGNQGQFLHLKEQIMSNGNIFSVKGMWLSSQRCLTMVRVMVVIYFCIFQELQVT